MGRTRADNWDKRTADKCKLPSLISNICEGCRDYDYCHRQLTLDDIQEKEEEK